MAVIVNDMPEVNIDADLMRAGGGPTRTDEIFVQMSNGCIRSGREPTMKDRARDKSARSFVAENGLSEPCLDPLECLGLALALVIRNRQLRQHRNRNLAQARGLERFGTE